MFLIPIIVGTIAFAVLAPIVGCLLAGLDRKLSARMQGRVGPPILQPYYDVRKLLEKDRAAVNSVEGTYITCALAFAVLAGGIFFGGGNLLLSVFVLTLSSLFFILAAYCTRSPYSEVGAAREALQIMAEEPMSLFIAVAFFGFLFILTIKMRKSPFDLSYSHHAHQELVKGVTTEMSGRTLAKVEVMHWCENVLALGWIGLFFVWGNPVSIVVAIVAAALAFFLEILIDNNFARVKWQLMLKSAWAVALVAGGINMAVLVYL